MIQRRTGAETKRAIIEAAGRLFADRGFAGVTARQVAQDAGVALSAIPYHFGTMESLYRDALVLACQVAPEAAPLAAKALESEPGEALRMAVRWTIADVRAAASTWQIRLLFREEVDPSPAYQEVIALKVVPEWNWLCEVVSRASGRPAGSPEVKFGVIAMHSLTTSFYLRGGMFDHLAPEVADVLARRAEPYVECMARLTITAVEAFSQHISDGQLGGQSPGAAGARREANAQPGPARRSRGKHKGGQR